MRLLAILFSLTLLSFTVGCDLGFPRGESKSLDEVVSIARTRYVEVQSVSVKPEVETLLKPTIKSLEDLVNNPRGGGVSRNAKMIAESLSSLATHTSYTNRPALGELLSQYLVIGNKPAGEVNHATVKLLAARTYSLIASELETQRFSL